MTNKLLIDGPAAKNPKTTKARNANAKKLVDQIVDVIAKTVGAVFFIATSYGYVSEWLKVHQSQRNIATAGAILVVSVALYLYTRKR